MLKIQEFIRTHSNWEELLTAPPFNLKIKKSNGLVIFNYTITDEPSDFNEPICREARGLILDEYNWSVVRLAFYKFFNYGEPYATEIDWSSAEGQEKIDGSIVTLYYYDNSWNVATNSMINAYEAPLENGEYKTFGQLFDVAAKNSGLDYSKLNPNYNYTFELVSPYSRVVLYYSKPELYHIGTRDISTLQELNINIGIKQPARYYLGNLEDYLEFVKAMDESHEGIVVVDKNFNRVKIKTEHYLVLHYLVQNHTFTTRKTLEIIGRGEQDEIITYFPEHKEWFDRIKSELSGAQETINTIQREVDGRHSLTKAEFAAWVNSSIEKKFRRLYFLAWDNNLQNFLDYSLMEKPDETRRIKDIITIFGIGT